MVPALTDEVSRLRTALGKGLCVCVLGSTRFNEPSSEEIVKALGCELDRAIGPSEAFFVTGGMGGVQECFAKNCGDGSRVSNLLPRGQASSYGVGTDIHAGADAEERKVIFGQLGDVYITVEGGPGVSLEANVACTRGAIVLPLMRTGGASSGMFNFPPTALEKPAFASGRNWELLQSKEAQVGESVAAVVSMVKQIASERIVSARAYDRRKQQLQHRLRPAGVCSQHHKHQCGHGQLLPDLSLESPRRVQPNASPALHAPSGAGRLTSGAGSRRPHDLIFGAYGLLPRGGRDGTRRSHRSPALLPRLELPHSGRSAGLSKQ